jgi:hypothetical protein
MPPYGYIHTWQVALVDKSRICAEPVIIVQLHIRIGGKAAELVDPHEVHATHRSGPCEKERARREHGQRAHLGECSSHCLAVRWLFFASFSLAVRWLFFSSFSFFPRIFQHSRFIDNKHQTL